MRILFIGDIMGRSGRDALSKHLPSLRERLKSDVVIVNGENAAHGSGITKKICEQFYELGVDCITTGNHIWGQRDIILYIDKDPRLLRPVNYPENTPGNGLYKHQLPDGRTITIINVMGNVFMPPPELNDSFASVNKALQNISLGKTTDAIFIDIHAEATSEKMAMGHYLDGRVSVVVGTHTHIPTADAQIFKGGTGFQADAGMTGDYDSVIGMRKDIPIQKFVKKMPTERMKPADGEGTVCGIFVVTDDKTCLARYISPVRVGPNLREIIPEFD